MTPAIGRAASGGTAPNIAVELAAGTGRPAPGVAAARLERDEHGRRASAGARVLGHIVDWSLRLFFDKVVRGQSGGGPVS